MQYETFSVDKNIYVRKGAQVNDFSLHMMPPLSMPNRRSNAYLSIASSSESFDDSEPLSPYNLIHFFNTKYDKHTRTFSGTIYWPKSYLGAEKMEWTLVFSEDFRRVVKGSKIVSFNVDGKVQDIKPCEDYMLLEW